MPASFAAIRPALALTLAATLAACATPPPFAGARPFAISAEAVQWAVGCLGGGDIHYDDGTVLHETIVCAGTYSPGTCTAWRAGAGRDLVARCRYSVTYGRRVRAQAGYFRCDSPTDDLRGCHGDFNWKDLGPSPPRPLPIPPHPGESRNP